MGQNVIRGSLVATSEITKCFCRIGGQSGRYGDRQGERVRVSEREKERDVRRGRQVGETRCKALLRVEVEVVWVFRARLQLWALVGDMVSIDSKFATTWLSCQTL